MAIEHECDYSLRVLQELNAHLYRVSDDRKYGLADIISYLHRHVTQILKNVRKNNHTYTKYHLCSAFSWTMAYANRMHIDVPQEMWNCFPGVCPYCIEKPCVCKQRGSTRSRPRDFNPHSWTKTINDWQVLLAEIYQENTLLNSAMHLAEEIGELNEASRNYRHATDEPRFNKVIEEVVDVFANLLAVATCMNFSFGTILVKYFSRGNCPKCKKSPCECPYVELDEPIEF